MRIFLGGLATETNTFAPWPTGQADFDRLSFSGDASQVDAGTAGTVARTWRTLAKLDNFDVTEGLFASAEPSGPTIQSVYEALSSQLLDDIRSAGKLDVILLLMNGAMVSTDCDDCEGDLVMRIRALVGDDVMIGVLLDAHCHLTTNLVETADVTVLLKSYPHDDYVPRATELYKLCVRAARREIRPVARTFDCRMVGIYPTTNERMACLVAALSEAETRPGILSASLAHGFPWGDTPDTGAKALVVTDDDAVLARREAERLGRLMHDARQELMPRLWSIDQALDVSLKTAGMVLIADTADNAGGGAPSDNVSLLREVLRREMKDVVSGCYWDPVAVQVCANAGVGAKIALRLGGKSGAASGDPIDIVATVKAVREAHDQTGLGGARAPFGYSVWLKINNRVDVVVTSLRHQTISPDAFTGLGLNLASKKLIIVKSSRQFETAFQPIADLVLPVATPGALQMDFVSIAYRKRRDLNFHPRIAAPFG